MSVLEIWGAEYQENDCLLLKQEDCAAFEAICARERCSMQAGSVLCHQSHLCTGWGAHVPPGWTTYKGHAHETALYSQVLGEIDGSGRITLVDPTAPPEAPTPVDLDLEKVAPHRNASHGMCLAASAGVRTGLGALGAHPLRASVQVLGKMPNKTFKFQRQQPVHQAFSLPEVKWHMCCSFHVCIAGYISLHCTTLVM